MTHNFLSKYKNLFTVFIIIFILFMVIRFGFDNIDHALLLSLISKIKIPNILIAIMAIIAVFILSTSRFVLINKKFGGDEDFLFLHRVNMLSLLYGQVALPFFAQIIGRIAHGTYERSIYYAPITIFEKSIALAIMFILGGSASILLLNKNIFPAGLLDALVVIIVGMILVLVICSKIVITHEQRQQFATSIIKITEIGILPTIVISIVIQIIILITYTIIALQFVPNASIYLLMGGFAIVVLITSIPLGFGGWGIREASSAGVFFSLGMPPEIGILVGLLYGLLNLIVLVLSVFILSYKINIHNKVKKISINSFKGVDIWPVTFFILMALLPFQIRVPMVSGIINISSVDILSLMIMINFTLGQFFKKQLLSIWIDRSVWFGVIGFTIAIILGWVVGLIYFGTTEWATFNRLGGLITVLSFLFTGAAMRCLIKKELNIRLGFVLAFSIIISCFYKVIIFNFAGIDVASFFNWNGTVNGFIGDRNGFVFLGALCINFIALNLPSTSLDKKLIKNAVIFISIIMALIIFTGSRSGLGAVIFITIWMVLCLKKYLPIILVAFISTSLLLMSFNIFNNASHIEILDGRSFKNIVDITDVRLGTWKTGIKLFLENPFFGGGLGSSLKESGFVIHNVWLWILGEMGLLGIFLCIPLVWGFLKTVQQYIYQPNKTFKNNSQLHGVLLFIIIVGGFSLFQDIAYQRFLWLLLGFIMAKPLYEKRL